MKLFSLLLIISMTVMALAAGGKKDDVSKSNGGKSSPSRPRQSRPSSRSRSDDDEIDYRKEYKKAKGDYRRLKKEQNDLKEKFEKLESDYKDLQTTLDQALMKWKSEGERLETIAGYAMTGHWMWSPAQEEELTKASERVPWLVDVGKVAGQKRAFIKYCTVSLVDLEDEKKNYALVTSAKCGHMLQEAGSRAWVHHLLTFPDGLIDQLVAVKYHHDYKGGMDANIALLKTNSPKLFSKISKRLSLPSSDTDVPVRGTGTGTGTGTVTWRTYHYDVLNRLSTPGKVYTKDAEIKECLDGKKRKMMFCVFHKKEKKGVDLGGSPFYIEGTGDRLLLKGIRTHLAGDQFIDIGQFAKWIRKAAKKDTDWIPLGDSVDKEPREYKTSKDTREYKTNDKVKNKVRNSE